MSQYGSSLIWADRNMVDVIDFSCFRNVIEYCLVFTGIALSSVNILWPGWWLILKGESLVLGTQIVIASTGGSIVVVIFSCGFGGTQR
jgi:hypothetical protein